MNPRSLNGAGVALALGVHRSTVTRWKQDGCPYDSRKRMFDLALVAEWLMAREFQRGQDSAVSSVASDGDAERLMKAKADMAELKLAEHLKVFLRAADVERQWRRALSTFRQHLEGLPARLAPLLEGRSRDAIYTIIEDNLLATVDSMVEVYTSGADPG